MRRRCILPALLALAALWSPPVHGAPRAPVAAGVVTVSDEAGLGQIELHGKVGAVNQRDEGLVALIDLSDPIRPKVLSRFDPVQEGGHVGTGGVPYDGDLAFSSDGAFLFYARQTSDYSEEGLHVLDVSDPAAPHEVFYQPQGGMLRLAYYDDGSAEWVVTLDAVEGLVVSRFVRPAGMAVPVHVDALPALKVGGPASAGLLIDDSDPGTGPPLLYVTTGQTGLQIFDFSNPAAPEELGSWSQVGLADVEVVATKKRRLVYAATEYWFDRTANQVAPEIVILDATDPAAIEKVGSLSLGLAAAPETRVQGIEIAGGRLYAAHSGRGLVVFDLKRRRATAVYKDPAPRNEGAGVPGAPYAMDVEAAGPLLYLTDGATGRMTVLRR